MNLLKQSKYVVKAVKQHSRIRVIFLQHNIPSLKDGIFNLITVLVKAEFAKNSSGGALPSDADHDYSIKLIQRKLKPPLNDNDINAIHYWAKKIAQVSIKLHENPM
ncbi:unnamed protein product [Rotaria sp. Silwood2]|nr:unnamed protein product [Rotaria sp. Silwood2]CAF2960415.1 unnamed protein product [Rotaria sp. Silwood2]CAF3187217.1 unnamed protein product [Rotaria sp. Silwood2]CAF3347106.1 unnamed protein product [Rotaria sp. Silwood2]CAF4308059.1 unnamed protein product [Rotaria sp. Silwood2]